MNKKLSGVITVFCAKKSNHTARTYLIDATGNLRLSYRFQTPVEDIANSLKILLK